MRMLRQTCQGNGILGQSLLMTDLNDLDLHNVTINIPTDAQEILSTLEADGRQAYVVGGCVRDSLIGRTPGDWDITTSALPMQVKQLFRRTVDTGIKHGTVTVMMGDTGYEVTTYRIDGNYADGRHPDSVEFSANLRDDLKRRDFTINAMAYNNSDGLVDEFNGIGDLQAGIVRCVGDARERFTEDALRMMRAIRFSAQLGFIIDEDTYSAIGAMADTISKVSMERIHDELGKILMSDHPDYVKRLCDTRLTQYVLPVMDSILTDRRCNSTLTLLMHAGNSPYLRYAALYNAADADNANAELKALKLDNNTINTVTKIVRLSKTSIDETEPAVREAIHMYGRDFLPLLMRHQTSVIAAKEETTGIMMTAARKHVEVINRLYEEIIKRGDCISIKDLDISGSDLMELGMSGPRIGETLNSMLHIVMENPKLNDKETLIAMLGTLE